MTQLRTSKGQFQKGTHYRPHQSFREEQYLREEYAVRLRSASDIAKEFGVTIGAVLHWMKQYGIARRNTSQTRRLKYWRGPKTIKVNKPWRKMTAEETREYRHLISLACPDLSEQRRERERNWQIVNADRCDASKRKHQKRFADRIRARGREHDRNRRPQRAAYGRRKRQTDVNFRIACNLRGRVNAAMRGRNKSASTLRLLGCSIESFKIYLESKWQTGMTWENYGRYPGWQIDHEMPCSIFDLTKPEHQKRCFHFSNMQPMWAVKNQQKNSKVLTNQFNLL